jgi:hypothetical protein
MSPKTLAILAIDHYRRARPIENVRQWAASRSIETVAIDLSSLQEENASRRQNAPWEKIGALYAPMLGDHGYFGSIPTDIPVILDWEFCAGDGRETDKCFQTHRVAVRRAFGGPVRFNAEFQVPFLHLPARAPEPTQRDVIVFDVHKWLKLPWHATLLSYLAIIGLGYERLCKAAGCDLKFYLASFYSLAPYLEGAQAFVEHNSKCHGPREQRPPNNPLRVIEEHLIPPCPKAEDYVALIARARLFITDNGELADQDIINAGTLGAPIVLVSRNPFCAPCGMSFSVGKAASAIEPRFAQLLDAAERNRVRIGLDGDFERAFTIGEAPRWDPEVLASAYMKSWDLLWDWATTGRIDASTHEAILRSKGAPHHAVFNG